MFATRSLTVAGLLATLAVGVAGSARAQSGNRHPSMARSRPTTSNTLGLRGYCPVCVLGSGAWMAGRPDLTSVYDGFVYRFPGDEQKQMFDANPDRYAPVLNGDSVVSYVKSQKRVPGKLEFAQIHDGRLYLFASEDERRAFQQSPGDYARADLAHGGQCAVCRVAKKQAMPAKPEISARYKGLRYVFIDAETRDMFLANPAMFAVPAQGSAASAPDAGSGSR